MICKLCAWAADTFGDAQWIEGSERQYAIPGEMKAAAAEAHSQCAATNLGCDCQHWLPGLRTHIVKMQWRSQGDGWIPLTSYPTRCPTCYRRTATTKEGLIWRHKLGHLRLKGSRVHPICPGSGMAPLAKGTAGSAISSSAPGDADSSSTPDTSPGTSAEL